MGWIEPKAEQIQGFISADLPGPIHMLNMLKFRPDGGAEKYAEYMAHTQPLLEARGGKMIYHGKPKATVIGDEDWDLIFIIHYPDRAAFLDMIQSTEYQQGAPLRSDALEDSRLICLAPQQ
jgi:uncharacterized protein (DUF1330 family)